MSEFHLTDNDVRIIKAALADYVRTNEGIVAIYSETSTFEELVSRREHDAIDARDLMRKLG